VEDASELDCTELVQDHDDDDDMMMMMRRRRTDDDDVDAVTDFRFLWIFVPLVLLCNGPESVSFCKVK